MIIKDMGASQKAYYERNKEEINLKRRERSREYRREYYEKNKEKVDEYSRNYQEKKKEEERKKVVRS